MTKDMGWTNGQLASDGGQFVQVGQSIDGYRLERELGRSAHGVSFYARRVTSGPLTWNVAMTPEFVVLKLLWPPIGLKGERALANFQDRFAQQTVELQTLFGVLISSAAEVGAAQVISWGGAPQRPYMIRCYVDGYSLADRFASQERGLPLVEVASYIMRTAAALDYAHTRGSIHGALTLENMLVSQDGHLLISDFGIERLLHPLGNLPALSAGLQAARYSPPERFGNGRLTPAMDIYSLGVALYALVCGRFPYDGATVEEIRRARVSGPAPFPRTYRQALPPQVEEVMMKALAKTPKDGFATVGALANAFVAAVEGATGEKFVTGRGASSTPSESQSYSMASRRARGRIDAAYLEPRPGAPEADDDGASPADWPLPASAMSIQREHGAPALDTRSPAAQTTITDLKATPMEALTQGAALQPDTAKAPKHNAIHVGVASPQAMPGPILSAGPALRLGRGPRGSRRRRRLIRRAVIAGTLLIFAAAAIVALTQTARGGTLAPGAAATPTTTMAADAAVTNLTSVTIAPTTTSHPGTAIPKPTKTSGETYRDAVAHEHTNRDANG